MAFTRLPLKVNINNSHIRLLSPLSSKSANISTCSNVPLVQKASRAKRILDSDNKNDVFQRGRVRYRSFRNAREEKKLRSIPTHQIDAMSTDSRSKSTPLFHTIEDHLQPRKVVISTKKTNTNNSFSVLQAKNNTDNKYVTYIQNQRLQSDLTSTKENIQPKQYNTQKITIEDDFDNVNDVINAITENQVRHNLNKVKESVNLHMDCIKGVYDTIISFKKKHPHYKSQSISTNRGPELRRNVEEIIKFFEDLKERVIVRNTKVLTNESYSRKRYENTSDFLQSPVIFECKPKESGIPIHNIAPSSATTNIQDETSENDSNTNNDQRYDPPYKSYSEVLTEILKSGRKSKATSGARTSQAENNSPIFSHHSNSDTNSCTNFTQQKACYSSHALTSNMNKAVRIEKNGNNFSTSPMCYKGKCRKPPSTTRCDIEDKEKDTEEERCCVQPINPECQPVCPEMPKTAPPLKRLKKVEIPEPKKVCPPPPCDDVVRADDNYKIQPKKLPVLKPSSCPCVEPFVPSKSPTLKRLGPINLTEPEKICPEETCPPRADDNYKVVAKKLPKLYPSDCLCVEPEIPTEAPRLRRLKLNIPEPPRVCNPCEIEFCCPPRMDAGLKVTQKRLPPMEPSDCPCVEPHVPTKAPSLKRLGPINIIEPPRVCPVEECPPTMDQLAKFKVVKRTLPKLKNSDCPCVEPEIPDKAPPLKRLKKVIIPEPPKVCPPPPCEDVVRADDNYKVEPKKLPEVPTGSCPCVEPFVPSKSPPLKRLGPINIPEPEKICIEETCPPRADDNYKVVAKQLPKLHPSDCPCVEPEIPTEAPRLRRLKLNIPEPPRVCEPCEIEFCCPPRMDAGLKVTQKRLPPMEPSDCPCVEPHVPTKAPSLKRLGPINIIEPPRVCPVEECPPTMDQLAKFKVVKRTLPKLKNSDCPCVEPEIPDKAPPLKRLKKVIVPEPPKVCPPPPCEDVVRADDNYRIEPKKLPEVPTGSCPCVEPFVPSKSPPLKRLGPINIPEPEKICIEETCPPRADDNYKVVAKQLPKLHPSDCPCVEPEIPTEAPRLRRLKLNIPEPPRVCEPCEIEFCCPPRMDAGLKVSQKRLPPMEPSDCPCVEPHVPTKAPSLKRLGPINIIEPPRVCPVEECPPTMDQLAKFKVVKRTLPKLKNSDCPCVEPEIPDKAPPLKRLKKVIIPEPPKVCPPPPCEDVVRADDNYKVVPKKLPQVPTGSCPCVEPFVPSKSPPLKRLGPINIPEPEKICIEETCPPRADDNYKVVAKQLPKLHPSDCPCVEPEIPTEAPRLRRLKLNIPEPPRVCEPCEIEFCCPPRMDAGLKITQKRLPPMEPSDCPCVEPHIPSKAPSLKRLGPINIIEPPRVCPVEECPPTMDQLANFKVIKRTLPKLKDSDCLCVEPEIPDKAPPLKRLKKVIIPEPPKVCPPPPCEDVVRADDNFRVEPKKLPEVPTGSCPCVEPFVPSKSPALKRLGPINIPEPEKICIEETCPPRADDNYKVVAKQLPKLHPSDCPCVEPEIPTEAPRLRRLKLNIPEPPRVCDPCEVEFCCPPRLDAGLKVKQRKLPPLEPSACPCVEPHVPSKAPSLKRLGPINIIEPPRVCPVEECPPTMDQLSGYKVKPKKLKTLILNECFNTMSTKEYNERFQGKIHTPKRKYGTKTMFTNFLSRKYDNFYSKHNFSYGSFRYLNQNPPFQPYLLSSWSNSSSTTDDESSQDEFLEDSGEDQDFVTKFATQCKRFLSDVSSTLTSFRNAKEQFGEQQDPQKEITYLFKKKITNQKNAIEDKCKGTDSNSRIMYNNQQYHLLDRGVIVVADQPKKSMSNSHSSLPSKTQDEKKSKSCNSRGICAPKNTRIACNCGKLNKVKHHCQHRFMRRKRRTIIHNNNNNKNRTLVPNITNSCHSKENSSNDIKTNNITDFILSSPNIHSITSTTDYNKITSLRKQPACTLNLKIYPTKCCKVKLSRKRHDKYLTGFKLSRKKSKAKFLKSRLPQRKAFEQSVNDISKHLKNNNSCIELERGSSQFFYENFLSMIQRLAKCPMPKESGEREVRLKAYAILEILRKLQRFITKEPKKAQKSSIEDHTSFQLVPSNTFINEPVHFSIPEHQTMLEKYDRMFKF